MKKYLMTNLLNKYYIKSTFINGFTSIYKGKLLNDNYYDFNIWLNPHCGIYITLFAERLNNKLDHIEIAEFIKNFNIFYF